MPSPSVIIAALRAARRVNDYPTAVRIFEGAPPPPSTIPNTLHLPPPASKKPRTYLRSEANPTTVCTGIKVKVENRGQYHEYLRELESLRAELGVDLKEDLYPEEQYKAGAAKNY